MTLNHECPRCHGIGPAKILKGHFIVCCYCNSTGTTYTDKPIEIPYWFKPKVEPKDDVRYL